MSVVRADAFAECRTCKGVLPGETPTDPEARVCDFLGFCSKACFDNHAEAERKKKAQAWAEERERAKQRRLEEDFYNSREWNEVRYFAFEKYGNYCLVCGRGRKHGAVLHVDHIKPRSKYPELALDIENLQILCADCNLGKGNRDDTDWRGQAV